MQPSAKVTGTLVPDSTGSYNVAGMFGGKNYYRRKDGAWFIWWQGPAAWIISEDLGVPGVFSWSRIDPSEEGDYNPIGGAAGIATVTLFP